MIVKSWSKISIRAQDDDCVERLLRFSFSGRSLVAWRCSNLLVEASVNFIANIAHH